MDKYTLYELEELINNENYIYDDFQNENNDQIKAYSYLVYLSLLDYYENKGIFNIDILTESNIYNILLNIKSKLLH